MPFTFSDAGWGAGSTSFCLSVEGDSRGGMTGVGAETLEASAGGNGDGATGAEGSNKIPAAGWLSVAFWREVSAGAGESIRNKETWFLPVKNEYSIR
jgi:hypothetical protein